MISAQARPAFVAGENRLPLFRIMLSCLSMICSENRLPLFRIMLCPKSSGSEGLPVPQPRIGRGCMRQRESLIGVAWGARPKPGPASPANMSKQGLSARHYVPNQTLIMVNARLPKGILAAGNRGNPGG
jgi:hypothetical protein